MMSSCIKVCAALGEVKRRPINCDSRDPRRVSETQRLLMSSPSSQQV
jgi:hypothetical protein